MSMRTNRSTKKVFPIRETSTMTFYEGPLGEISVPKKTRICTVCGQEAFMNIDEIQRHRKHGGKLILKPELRK